MDRHIYPAEAAYWAEIEANTQAGKRWTPLRLIEGDLGPQGSLARMMARRYEAYKSVVVRPFFRDHFARLDRQIVLVDVLTALNAGPAAVGSPR